MTPADPQGIPYYMMSCSVYKLEGKLAEGVSALGLAGHWPAFCEHFAPLVLYIVIFFPLLFLFY